MLPLPNGKPSLSLTQYLDGEVNTDVATFLFGVGDSNMDGFPGLRTTAQQRGANCRIRDSWLSSSPSCWGHFPGWTWHPGPWPKERTAFLCGWFHGDSHTAWNLRDLSPRDVPQETVGLLAWRRRSPEQPTGGAAGPTREGVSEWRWKQISPELLSMTNP